MTTNLQQRIDQMMALDAKRTQGEWRHAYGDGSGQDHVTAPLDGGSAIASTDPYGLFVFDSEITEQAKSDAAFIAAAPEMVAIIREQQAIIEGLLEAVKHAATLNEHRGYKESRIKLQEALARFSPTGGKQ